MSHHEKPCASCGTNFSKKPTHSVSAWASARYCSKACYTDAQRVSKQPPTQRYIGTPWNKGKALGKSPRNTRSNKECLNCSKLFEVKLHRADRATYCSQACSYAHRTKGPIVNECRTCSAKFTRPTNPLTAYQFCSPHCRAQAARTVRQSKSCEACGKKFDIWPYEATRKCCSSKCATKLRDRGLTTEAQRIRSSTAYAHWRTAVFARDNFTCQICGQRGGQLCADHIKRFSDYPELRLDVSNGRTLCNPCHLATPTFGNRKVVAVAQEA